MFLSAKMLGSFEITFLEVYKIHIIVLSVYMKVTVVTYVYTSTCNMSTYKTKFHLLFGNSELLVHNLQSCISTAAVCCWWSAV